MYKNPSLPVRRTEDLLIGRRSIQGAIYFLTLCETKRRAALFGPAVVQEIQRSLDRLHIADDFTLIAATIMPDHIHVLGALGERLALNRVVAKFKSSTRTVLAARGLGWQENFYEHRVQDETESEPFARYIFLNPYRAGLLRFAAKWPLWWRWGDRRFEFEAMVAQAGGAPSAWLGEVDPAGASDL
jgi:REP element-mobilizing transposase RayT